jgi:hypothetical protein
LSSSSQKVSSASGFTAPSRSSQSEASLTLPEGASQETGVASVGVAEAVAVVVAVAGDARGGVEAVVGVVDEAVTVVVEAVADLLAPGFTAPSASSQSLAVGGVARRGLAGLERGSRSP